MAPLRLLEIGKALLIREGGNQRIRKTDTPNRPAHRACPSPVLKSGASGPFSLASLEALRTSGKPGTERANMRRYSSIECPQVTASERFIEIPNFENSIYQRHTFLEFSGVDCEFAEKITLKSARSVSFPALQQPFTTIALCLGISGTRFLSSLIGTDSVVGRMSSSRLHPEGE